jgi:lysozyme
MNYPKGIDVSTVQGAVDWPAVAAAGYTFAIVKCGQGNSGFDPDYTKNVAGARAAGLKVAAYHFVYPLPPQVGNPSRAPEAQAKLHFDHAGPDIVACIDCEWPAPQDWAKWGCTASQINAWILAYLSAYQALSNATPIVYTYPDWAAHVGFTPEFAAYPLWAASYQLNAPLIPHPWTDWVLWQNSGGGGKLPNGAPVDTDYAKDLSIFDAVTSGALPNA